MDQRENAMQCMIEWLSHENELGKKPYQIQIAGEFDLHDLHYYIFKFKSLDFLLGLLVYVVVIMKMKLDTVDIFLVN